MNFICMLLHTTGLDSVDLMEPLQQSADASFIFKVHGSNFRSGFKYQSIFACEQDQCRLGSPSHGSELAVACKFGMCPHVQHTHTQGHSQIDTHLPLYTHRDTHRDTQ